MLDEVKQLKNQIELMTEGRSLDVPDLPGGVNFVPEQERNPEGQRSQDQGKEERQQQYTKAFLKGLRGKDLPMKSVTFWIAQNSEPCRV